jgi:CMP-N-acetylneuraminic acid synthetase
MSLVAIIPARGGSKRFPRKNLSLLAGRPLVEWTVTAARESGVFDLVCVSSDDDDILNQARSCGADLVLRRPAELATDTATVKAVCLNVLEELDRRGQEYEHFAVLLVTSPLRRPEDLRRAYRDFRKSEANYLMSLVPYAHPPQRAVWAPEGYVRPFFGPEYLTQTQRLEPLYRHDGSFIFGRTEVFRREGDYYGSKVMPFLVDPVRSVDIDDPLDLKWAEFLLSEEGGAVPVGPPTPDPRVNGRE